MRELELECSPGVATCLVGPNGAGKSTVLALAAGLLSPTAGQVRLGKRPIEAGAALASTGYLPQITAYPAAFRVREVIGFTAVARATGQADLDDVLEVTGLRAVMARPVKALSGGWLRRLGLACALLPPADRLLLDEPFVGLDPGTLDRLVNHLIARARRGALVLLASHDFEVMDLLSPQVVALDDGQRLNEPQAAPDGSRALYRRLLSRPGGLTATAETIDER
ncbi:MAG: ATP-binding cassette domain-containing protein [Acidobacteriota bacterium]